jgi:alpha-1,6-mannosyltransferase
LRHSDFHWESNAVGAEPTAFDLGARWAAASLAVIAYAAILTSMSGSFGYDVDVVNMPCLLLVAILIAAGTAYALAIPGLVNQSQGAPVILQHRLLVLVLFAGLAARLTLFGSEPILEDDYNRYLWDGAVTASGQNPYAHSPLAVRNGQVPSELAALATQSGDIFQRINHKSLTTIYPPVAQAAFATANAITPWSLMAWRGVLLVCDIGTFLLLIRLLDAVGRPRLWVALYWLNPVVLKEIFNSAHMEGILLPFVLLALLLTVKRRPLWATASLGVAAGVKFWPIILAPLVLRSFWGHPFRLAVGTAILGSLMALWLAPMLLDSVGKTTGLVAYVDRWQTNSALFPVIEGSVSTFQDWIGPTKFAPGLVARGLIAAILVGLAFALAYRPIHEAHDLVARSAAIVATLVLLSPAQFPWYTVWMAPFLAFHAYPAFLLLSALIPIYYTLFHFVARNQGALFNDYVVWMIWAPVLATAIASVAMGAIASRSTRISGRGPGEA